MLLNLTDRALLLGLLGSFIGLIGPYLLAQLGLIGPIRLIDYWPNWPYRAYKANRLLAL